MELHVTEEISDALASNRPVVALETTVITHGMPHPHNVEVALAMERTIRAENAIPATLGVVNGHITVGLSREIIEQFGAAESRDVTKCSRRDLPSIVACGSHGSLTVAGTMMVARAAGIPILATGGIGGVHRNHPFDVSADLTELGRTPVAIVCAGAKSILDLPLTLEVLETHGVPVIGIHTATLPAFYARDSGLRLPAGEHSLEEAAGVFRAWQALAPSNGLLFVTPVPSEHALSLAEAEAAIAQALEESEAAGIHGNRVTPFLLRRISELSNGQSLVANKALLINNARIAAKIAHHYRDI